MTEIVGIRPLQRTTVHDEIIEALMTFILEGGFEPGQKLPAERELMAGLAVGRSSLREAIKSLRALGVIEVVPGEGMFVGQGGLSVLAKPLSWGLLMQKDSAEEVIEARGFIERQLAGLAAERSTVEDKEHLTAAIARMKDRETDPSAYVDADLSFHLAVARAAHNAVLHHILQTLQSVMRAWMVRVLAKVEHKPASLHEHIPIYEAIMDGDAPRAREAMSRHLESAGERLLVAIPTEKDS